MPMILLAVVGSSNQSNTITMMSLLWWGALTNQNHAQSMEVYRGRLPWEFTTEDYHGSLPRKITMGVYCQRLPRDFTVEDYCGSLPWEITMGVYHGRLLWEFIPIRLTIGCP